MVKQKVFVCGGTGKKGEAVVRSLIADGRWLVVAGTTDTGSIEADQLRLLGASVARIHMQSQLSLEKAFNGMDAVFAVTQPWLSDQGSYNSATEIRHAKNIIWAAKEAKVGHFVFSSFLNPEEEATGVCYLDSKLLIEGFMMQFKLPYTIIRSGLYMESMAIDMASRTVKSNFRPETRIPYIALKDFGEQVCAVLNNRQLFLYRKINLIGDLISGVSVCSLLNARHPGRPFVFMSRSNLFVRIFMPDIFRLRRYLGRIAGPLDDIFKSGKTDVDKIGLPPLTPLRDYVKKYI